MTTRQSGGPGTPTSPEQLRADIETTRQQLGNTVEALAARADVKAAARRKVTETRTTAAAQTGRLTRRAVASASQVRGQAAEAPGSSNVSLVAAAVAVVFTVVAIVAWRHR